MAATDRLNEHRSWEDWALFGLGAAVIMSLALDSATTTPPMVLSTILVGFAVLCLAISELALIERWEEPVTLVCGAWLIASPLVFGYLDSGWLGFSHIVLGMMIIAIASLELWQDRGGVKPLA